jgi:RimJ/RimL family protein N-acetyltransferase
VADTRASIAAARTRWGSGTRPKFTFVIERESEVIGSCDVMLGESEGRVIGEMTILLDSDERGRGYAKAALHALIDWAFENLSILEELWGTCVEDNASSARLMAALGMQSDGLVTANEGRSVWKYRLARPVASDLS